MTELTGYCQLFQVARSFLRGACVKHYHSVQEYYLSERCIEVDSQDNVIGSVSKGEAHRSPLRLHRAFSLFAFTPDRKLILQKRSKEKITFPSLWTNTCCSHPLHTEQEIDGERGVVRAATRKIEHELGVKTLLPENCIVMGRFLYKAEEQDWGEYELDYGIVTRGLSMDHISKNQSEVSAVKAVQQQELAEWIETEPGSFSPWFLLFFRMQLLSQWWQHLEYIENYVDMHIVAMN